jgi:hypothetical protein
MQGRARSVNSDDFDLGSAKINAYLHVSRPYLRLFIVILRHRPLGRAISACRPTLTAEYLESA